MKMRISKSAQYSVFFFLIFILGVIGFVAYINRSLNKKTEVLPKSELFQDESVTLAFEE